MPEYKFTIGQYPEKINPRVKILTGQRFGKLLVIGFGGIDACDLALWHCVCDCGNGITVRGSHLRRGTRNSCDCLHKSTHGTKYRNTPERDAFSYARSRCNNQNHREYPRYGARGIECRFESFEEFLTELGPRPEGPYSLDRIDNDGHYEKGNVQWATKAQQDINKRTNRHLTAFGVTKCLSEWESAPHSHRGRVATRLANKWCVECAVSLPPGGRCDHKSLM